MANLEKRTAKRTARKQARETKGFEKEVASYEKNYRKSGITSAELPPGTVPPAMTEAERRRAQRFTTQKNIGTRSANEETAKELMGMKKGGNWIKGAIKKPGALRASLGVKKGEKIPASKLKAAAKKGGKLGMRARLAITLKKMKSK